MSHLSVIPPISAAIGRTRRILFEPFLLSKWLRLGFCSFLMGSTQMVAFGNGRQQIQPDFGKGSGSVGSESLDAAIAWAQGHPAVILTAAGLLGILIVGFALLFTWLSSRAHFMLLDGIVRNRGAIKAPWHDYRREANSLFRFRLVFGLLSVIGLAVVLLPAILAGMTRIGGSDPGAIFWTARLVVLGVMSMALFMAWALAVGAISLLLADFVTPVMYLHRIPVMPAWRQVNSRLLREHPGSMALYVLTRILLNGATATLAFLATLLTCCLTAVPYIGSVLLLPLSVFRLSYPLAFLEQLGPEWTFFPETRKLPG